MSTLIRTLFVSDVTRDIPPVVYFHEQTPQKLAAEVSEYIITGGFDPSHPNHRRVPNGIHEQYVRLLTNIALELDKPGGPELPAAWISGFYGSGKSSFAKLLGLALDGVSLPDGTSVAEAWLRRDLSPNAKDLRDAWTRLRQKIEPVAVVFDIGGVARDNEHIHSAAVRQVQRRLGYCTTEPLVADFELRLERDGVWERFEAVARETLGHPWATVKDKALAEEDFSLVMSAMYPDRYTDPMSWFTSRGGTLTRADSPEEAVAAIRDMLRFRRPRATLFLVVDEVSQYVVSSQDRVDRLRVFATALGATLKGKAWLVALGQQRLDEGAGDGFLVWAKDRFPKRLQVHLENTNIRDVVHRRLLHKRPDAERALSALFATHRADLKLFAYGCENVTPEDFVETYPMLPGHVDLLLQITSALRTRSARAQGDDHGIRGLLQLLGELFRSQGLADLPIGALVTLDQIYEVQHTALDSDVQASMARVLSQCADDETGELVRAAKAVALLELIQDAVPTDARLVAQCLYDRLDRGNHQAAITGALEELRRRNLLGYSEKQGYKLQSSAGEEWERERRDIGVSRETISDLIQDALKLQLARPEAARMKGRGFPWAGIFSDGRRAEDAILVDPRDDAPLRVDFRYTRGDHAESTWIRRSDEAALKNRLVWVVGEVERVEELAREFARSSATIKKYKPRRESLVPTRKTLLQQEENRAEDLEAQLGLAVAGAWMAGQMYFRGLPMKPADHGVSFATALQSAGTRILPDLFPHFIATQVQPAELMQLVESELSGPSPKFLSAELGLLELESGRYVPVCSGVVPRRIEEAVLADKGVSGTALLAAFGGPPYGYTPNVVKACALGLLRAKKITIEPEGGAVITAVRDAGARDLFDKDRAFRRATLFPAGDDEIGPTVRARICKLLEERLGERLDREDHAIADAVAKHFPLQAKRVLAVLSLLNHLPDPPATPDALARLAHALEQCVVACRQTQETVLAVKRHLDALRDGLQLLHVYEAELTPAAIQAVRSAADVRAFALTQLRAADALTPAAREAGERLDAHLTSPRPWRDIAALSSDLSVLQAAYGRERGRLLEWQEGQAEQVRAAVKARPGFAILTHDQSHRVLRPIALAVTSTSIEAVAPSLVALADPFLVALRRAEEQANDTLDEIRSDADKRVVVRIDLTLRNREVGTEAEVEALVGEIRGRLLELVRTGARARLV